MAESMKGLKRSHRCTELSEKNIATDEQEQQNLRLVSEIQAKAAAGQSALLDALSADALSRASEIDDSKPIRVVGNKILESLNLRPRKLEIVSCPSCGRAQVDVYTLAEEVTKGLEGLTVPLRVAVMGCVVNGPGEAREADLGVASGNGKGQIFVKGEVIKTVPEDEIVETLLFEARRLAAEMGEIGAPEVSVS